LIPRPFEIFGSHSEQGSEQGQNREITGERASP
jgi:hypothetical protein